MNIQQKNIGTEKALQKIKHFCSYQERSHKEVKDKLYSFGLWRKEVEALLAQMIEENYLNEERFAIAFAGGRFRIKKWGRIKIKNELQQRQVSAYCIKVALAQIADADYEKNLLQLAETKWKSLDGEKNLFIKKQKLYATLIRKGYETDWVSECIGKITNG